VPVASAGFVLAVLGALVLAASEKPVPAQPSSAQPSSAQPSLAERPPDGPSPDDAPPVGPSPDPETRPALVDR
jgi:hypothetical protein